MANWLVSKINSQGQFDHDDEMTIIQHTTYHTSIWLNSRQKRLISPIFEGPKNIATDNLRLM